MNAIGQAWNNLNQPQRAMLILAYNNRDGKLIIEDYASMRFGWAPGMRANVLNGAALQPYVYFSEKDHSWMIRDIGRTLARFAIERKLAPRGHIYLILRDDGTTKGYALLPEDAPEAEHLIKRGWQPIDATMARVRQWQMTELFRNYIEPEEEAITDG